MWHTPPFSQNRSRPVAPGITPLIAGSWEVQKLQGRSWGGQDIGRGAQGSQHSSCLLTSAEHFRISTICRAVLVYFWYQPWIYSLGKLQPMGLWVLRAEKQNLRAVLVTGNFDWEKNRDKEKELWKRERQIHPSTNQKLSPHPWWGSPLPQGPCHFSNSCSLMTPTCRLAGGPRELWDLALSP